MLLSSLSCTLKFCLSFHDVALCLLGTGLQFVCVKYLAQQNFPLSSVLCPWLLWDLVFHPVSLPPVSRVDSVALYEMLSPDKAKEVGEDMFCIITSCHHYK